MMKYSFEKGIRYVYLSLIFALTSSAHAGILDYVWEDVSREWDSCFSGGCDVVWKVNQRIDGGVKSKGNAMAQGVVEVFEPAMARLINDQVRPLLEDIDVMIRNNMKESVEVAFSRIDETITKALTEAESGIKNVVLFAVDTAGKELDAQRKQLVADVNNIIDVIDCSAVGHRVAIENFISTQFKIFRWPWSRTQCQSELDLSNDRSKYSNSQLYREAICEYSRRLTPNTDVNTILFLYGDMQGIAARFQCLERRAPAAAENYTRDWISFGRSHAVWKATQ